MALTLTKILHALFLRRESFFLLWRWEARLFMYGTYGMKEKRGQFRFSFMFDLDFQAEGKMAREHMRIYGQSKL